ncbi:MAG: long-chain fatty acid--CoA ligase [Muribaculaceae bacterium]|nr:long-chain fatty acid--CoA ligase [Muribaculaceae bacterium]
MENTRCILPYIIDEQARKYGSRQALSWVNESGEELASYSYVELAEAVRQTARALAGQGLGPGDVCLVFSANRPEMIITDFACYANGAIPVSIYATASREQVAHIIENSQPKLAFAGAQGQYDMLASLGGIPKLYAWDGTGPRLDTANAVFPMDEIERRRAAVTPDDTATLIYTSGTTGHPKAADLPHRCFDAQMRTHRVRLDMLSDADRSLCFLPLCHIFEKAWTYLCITLGINIAINQNAKEIAKAVRAVRPTCMCSVPRFWEKAYALIQEKIAALPAPKRWLARAAVRCGHKRNVKYERMGRPAPWLTERLYRFFDRHFLAPTRRAMGVDQGNIFPTAGAPISPEIVDFFRSIGVPIFIGYGMSETTATVTCYPDQAYEIGSVGVAMPGVELRIGLEGEVQVRGDIVMRGYYRDQEATSEAFTGDGWLRTGDAGRIDHAGGLVLTERLKDLFKTSNGKYVAPQAIESRLGADKYIDQVAVVGESRSYVTAIIIPAYEALKDYARKKGIAFKSINDLIRNSEIMDMLKRRIDRLQRGLPSFEQIKKFTLLPSAFTIESGELTNTLKIRRPVIAANYASVIDSMY